MREVNLHMTLPSFCPHPFLSFLFLNCFSIVWLMSWRMTMKGGKKVYSSENGMSNACDSFPLLSQRHYSPFTGIPDSERQNTSVQQLVKICFHLDELNKNMFSLTNWIPPACGWYNSGSWNRGYVVIFSIVSRLWDVLKGAGWARMNLLIFWAGPNWVVGKMILFFSNLQNNTTTQLNNSLFS